MIEAGEHAILDALDERFPSYQVEQLHGSIQDYSFTHPKAAIVPILQSETYERGPSLDRSIVAELPEYQVGLFAHTLHGDDGAYRILGAMKDALEGLETHGPPQVDDIEVTGFSLRVHYSVPQDVVLRIDRTQFISSQPGGVLIYALNVAYERT